MYKIQCKEALEKYSGNGEPKCKTFYTSSTCSLVVAFCKYQKYHKYYDPNDTAHS